MGKHAKDLEPGEVWEVWVDGINIADRCVSFDSNEVEMFVYRNGRHVIHNGRVLTAVFKIDPAMVYAQRVR